MYLFWGKEVLFIWAILAKNHQLRSAPEDMRFNGKISPQKKSTTCKHPKPISFFFPITGFLASKPPFLVETCWTNQLVLPNTFERLNRKSSNLVCVGELPLLRVLVGLMVPSSHPQNHRIGDISSWILRTYTWILTVSSFLFCWGGYFTKVFFDPAKVEVRSRRILDFSIVFFNRVNGTLLFYNTL